MVGKMKSSAGWVAELEIKSTAHVLIRYPDERTLYAVTMERADVYVQVYMVRPDASWRPWTGECLDYLIQSGLVASQGLEEFCRSGEGRLSRGTMELLYHGVLVSVGLLRKLLGSDELYDDVLSSSDAGPCAN